MAAVVAVSELRGGDGGEVHGARHQDVVSRPVPVDSSASKSCIRIASEGS